MKNEKLFIKKYQLEGRKITLVEIEDIIINKQGIEICEYQESEEELKIIGFLDYSKYADSFIYTDKNHRILFINGNISEENRLFLLLHEEGHVWYNHQPFACINDNLKLENEREADNFANLLFKRNSNLHRLRYFILIAIIFIIVISTMIINLFIA
ncbi:MAG: ImmA/IrrE family metallo-endopeptidase [Oscillospiraceae bacterium]|jgi:Zn-dependent peptidase ImmA (M78 family)|nr:ImmA/IrrE family metallo-endopeptidase [Oscillospiraceae bacterium]